MRYVSHSTKVGPPPVRARSTASLTAAWTWSASLPSTFTPGNPYATALAAMLSLAVCLVVGTLIAQWLFWQVKTTGALKTPAKFIATWKSPSEVAPSPRYAAITVRSPLMRAAIAAPTACGSCVPMQEDQLTWFTLRDAMWLGICRPLVSSPALPKTWQRYGTSGKPRSSMAPPSRSAGKIQSLGESAMAEASAAASRPAQAP